MTGPTLAGAATPNIADADADAAPAGAGVAASRPYRAQLAAFQQEATAGDALLRDQLQLLRSMCNTDREIFFRSFAAGAPLKSEAAYQALLMPEQVAAPPGSGAPAGL